MTEHILPVGKGGASGAVNDFLKGLLSSGKVKAVLALQTTPNGRSAFPVLVSDPDKMRSDVFTPLMPVSTATILSRITKTRGSDDPIAAIMRNCELRALTELFKLKQADPANLVLIGVDCPGTFDLNTYSNFPGDKDISSAVLDPKEREKFLRSACRSCADPIPGRADIVIGTFGMDLEKGILVSGKTEAGQALLEGMGLDAFKDDGSREKAVSEVREAADRSREKHIAEHSDIKGSGKIADFFESCINCHNCMKACPICYCKECLFDSAVFNMEAHKYVSKAGSKGSFKTPTDTLLFHITRFNHMILSCVQCGLCEQACPANIPLMDIIIPIAQNAQKEFEYIPGRDLEDQLPMIFYKEEEFESVGDH
ncbi:MAG: Coenzyme F420 hydrogenase/dehydrogenase, beta subunit C-terminal domain [Candidatus Thermoplasmatota archaeon]|nr:Coenzyme F420 hydrogenase/dehydrogenase, beta subunit C-terminal domain [Candidatus Thermoplasmatota archaeon]